MKSPTLQARVKMAREALKESKAILEFLSPLIKAAGVPPISGKIGVLRGVATSGAHQVNRILCTIDKALAALSFLPSEVTTEFFWLLEAPERGIYFDGKYNTDDPYKARRFPSEEKARKCKEFIHDDFRYHKPIEHGFDTAAALPAEPMTEDELLAIVKSEYTSKGQNMSMVEQCAFHVTIRALKKSGGLLVAGEES